VFAALNTALTEDGAYLAIAPGTAVGGVIHLCFLADPSDGPVVMHPRILIHAGSNCQAQIVESYLGLEGGEAFTNAVVEMTLDEGAVVDHYRVQSESARAFHMSHLYARCDRNANLSSHSLGLGGAWVRNDITATLAGEGGECTLNGLYMADGQGLVDTHTAIDHAAAHCASHELYKGILGGHARGVFNGKIVVRPDAQKTDARQTNKALLLSDHAMVNSKPQLEIFANDVKCTHGAAIGQLDDEAVFYLRARGIGAEDARRMLVQAFARSVLDGIRVAPLREHAERALAERLDGMMARQA